MVWLLSFHAWKAWVGPPTDWVRWLDPFWLLFSNWSIWHRLPQQCAFFAACLMLTASLAGLSTWTLRAATLRRAVRRPRAKAWRSRRPSSGWLRWIGQGAPALDDDPILWREWHRKRPSTYALAIWWTYVVLCVLATVASPFQSRLGSFVNGLQVSIGLLLACVGAASSLAEERAQGGLDVVLASPVASRRIVLGKWWGAFRIVPRLAILPALLMVGLGWRRDQWLAVLWLAPVMVGLVLAYGAVVTGLGLLIAIHQPRQGRAVALTVASYLAVTIAYPAIVLPVWNLSPSDSLPLWPSPFFGILVPTLALDIGMPIFNRYDPLQAIGFLGFESIVALVLLRVALRSFDRGLGRIPDRSKTVDREPRPEVELVAESRT